MLGNNPRDQRIEEVMRGMTMSNTILSAPISVLCALTIFVALFYTAPRLPLLLWVGAQVVATAARFVHMQWIDRTTHPKLHRRIRWMITATQGLLWSSPIFFLVPDADIFSISFLTVVIIGVACGAMLLSIGEPLTGTLVAVPAMIGVTTALLQSGDYRLSILAVLGVLFYALVSITGIRLRHFFIENQKFQLSLQDKNEEITDKNAKLYRLAHFDSLTGAANRGLLIQHGNAYLDSAVKTGKLSAFLHIDLDHFKHLNDTMGHAAGDELLRSVSQRLRGAVRLEDVVARLGGDEFGVLAKGLENKEDAEIIAEKIINSLERPQTIMGSVMHCRASIGIAYAPRHGNNISELMNNSDLALQQAKKLGRGKYKVCSDTLQLEATRKLTVENELRQAIKDKTVCYHFQPIIRAVDGVVIGAEALMRVESSIETKTTATEFIEVAETVGLMDELGQILFESLETQGLKLFAAVPSMQKISVNLTPAELRAQTPVNRLETMLKRKIFRPEQLQIEITEQSVLERGSDRALHAIEKAFGLGISIVMDDFGTGYSSLTHLKMLPITGVKIDKSFVKELNSDMRDAAIVRSLIGMCKGLGLTVTAEGVENYAQLETLKRLGCDLVQGHLFFRAKGVEDLQKAVEKIGDQFTHGLGNISLTDVPPSDRAANG